MIVRDVKSGPESSPNIFPHGPRVKPVDFVLAIYLPNQITLPCWRLTHRYTDNSFAILNIICGKIAAIKVVQVHSVASLGISYRRKFDQANCGVVIVVY